MGSITDGQPILAALGIPPGAMNDAADDKPASPSDSINAEKNLAELDGNFSNDLHISTEQAQQANQDPLVYDAAANSAVANSAVTPPFSSDPLSATALTSPLHTLNWDAAVASQGGSIDNIVSLHNPPSNPGGWETFKRAGPRYPASLEKLIMDYHHRHSKSWQLVHDMGAGSGVFSPTLARYFRHVHVSDPSSAGSSSSRRLLSKWIAANKKSRGRFTFSTCIPERGHENVADGTVDMAVVMQGAHFTDATALVLSAAESLAPHGTLAIVSYTPVCRVTGNPRADAAVQALFTAWGSRPWDVICGDAKSKKQFSHGLNFVPVPDHLFTPDKTRRININTAALAAANTTGGTTAFAVPGLGKPEASDSRVRVSERRHEYTSEDEQGKGWRQEVGPEFFRSMTTALFGSTQAGAYEEQLKEIADVVHETSPNGIMIDVEWAVAVVLATKRSTS